EEQWVSEVIGYSSQYGRYKWSAKQIQGAPDVYPRYQDDKRAWAPDVIDENQFLEFEFDYPVYVTKVDVYETFNAGGVKAIKCFDVSGMWITLWSTPQQFYYYYSGSAVGRWGDKLFVAVWDRRVQFATAVYVTKIDVFETFNAGGVKAIKCFDVSGTWITLWSTLQAVQWVAEVINYSSQYGPYKWSAQQILGAPDVYPRYEDSISAWAPKVIDENQFLEFKFATSVYVTQVDVYETFNAGGVKAIKCFDVSGTWITLWSTPEVDVKDYAQIFSPYRQWWESMMPCFSNHIRLDIDCTVANTWVEIDAVRLHGSKEAVQWVAEVINYSSQYYSNDAQQILGGPDVYNLYTSSGQSIKAWAPDVIDENQFLELKFAFPVNVAKVAVYETFNAGGVKAIKCFDVSGTWITLWSTPKSTVPCFSNIIRLDIDCTAAKSRVEIDAVRLHGYQKSWGLAKREHVNEELEEEEDKAVTSVEAAAA
ncbi:hypothetical protein DPMN_041766, partial [Dreissena polymorpha]